MILAVLEHKIILKTDFLAHAGHRIILLLSTKSIGLHSGKPYLCDNWSDGFLRKHQHPVCSVSPTPSKARLTGYYN